MSGNNEEQRPGLPVNDKFVEFFRDERRKNSSWRVIEVNTIGTGSFSKGTQVPDRLLSEAIPFKISFKNPKVAPGEVPKSHRGSKLNDDHRAYNDSVTLLVNPRDMNLGSTAVVDNTYTRGGWVNALWGRSQTTLTANGVSAAFFQDKVGLAHTDDDRHARSTVRHHTLAYINFKSIVSFFKNNGYLFLSSREDGSTPSSVGGGANLLRVIHVIEDIHIEYDGAEYMGSFNSFTMQESAENPYRFDYSFEFVTSGIKGDKVEGHMDDGVNRDSGVVLGLQGANEDLAESLIISRRSLAKIQSFRAQKAEVPLWNEEEGSWQVYTNPSRTGNPTVVYDDSGPYLVNEDIGRQSLTDKKSTILLDGSGSTPGVESSPRDIHILNDLKEGVHAFLRDVYNNEDLKHVIIVSGVRTVQVEKKLYKTDTITENNAHSNRRAVDISAHNLTCTQALHLWNIARKHGAAYWHDPLHMHFEIKGRTSTRFERINRWSYSCKEGIENKLFQKRT